MPVAPLLRPDNRFIGPATSDLGLYGGQPAYGVTIGAPAHPEGGIPADVATSTQQAPAATPDAAAPHTQNTDAATPASEAAGSASSPSSLDHQPAQPVSPVDGAATSPGGSTPPGVLDALSPHAAALGAVSGNVPLTESDIAGNTAEQDAVTVIAHQIAGDATQLFGAVSGLGFAAAGLTGATNSITAPVFGGAGHIVTALTDGVVPAAADAIAAVPDALSDVPGTLSTLAGDPVDGVIGAAHALPEAMAHPGALVTTIASDATDTVDALSHIDATGIEGLAGSDPAGGVTTLVDMVAASELFTFGYAAEAAPTEQASTSIVDDLIGDASVASILGDTTHADHAGDAAHGIDHTIDHALGVL